ncbi:hypothetical protein BRADI_4g11060v3 [Brachypodium distachyon]|uniref:F-box domain-containing protein n=1 Tax=Brachypodium distachyon TaxID=15368 RepID=I1IJM8_BRADI|nr:hypothetical protein BRADI_4g11060v3 [Brachypodium distachyon]
MDIAVDALVEILLLLPPSCRRRCRLVCRQWRDTVDRHTTEMQSRAKPLVVATGSAYIVDDLSSTGRSHRRLLWTDLVRDDHGRNAMTSVVGTCNGLICLYDSRSPGGAIAVVNPVTNETLHIPPLPQAVWVSRGHIVSWRGSYSFAYHPTTGRYTVVHVPCDYGKGCTDTFLQVFTLGEESPSSWRSVAVAPDEICTYLEAGVVSVDGATYWATTGDKKIVAFDFDGSDRVTSVDLLPNGDMLSRPGSWNLAEVRGRLGVAFYHPPSISESKIEVWVLEGATTEERRWSRWYNVLTHSWHGSDFNKMIGNWHLARPHFAQGEDILTQDLLWDSDGLRTLSVSKHRRTSKDTNGTAGCYMVEVSERNRAMVVGAMEAGYSWDRRIFSYVETTEPLSIYMSPV